MQQKDTLAVAAVQFHSDESDVQRNLGAMEGFIDSAAAKGCDIICFPEICVTGYNWISRTQDRSRLLAAAEEVPNGPSTRRLAGKAAEKGICVLFGLLERDGEKLFNSYALAMSDGRVERYRKIHAFENSLVGQGEEFPVFDIHGWKCGVLVCFDNNLPENPRILALKGCELVFAPHQTGGFDMEVAGMGRIDPALWHNRGSDPGALLAEMQGPKGREWILKWLPSRAYDNGLYYVFSNGVGLDRDEVRTGNAMILDPDGMVLAESRSIEPDMIVARIEKKRLEGTLGRMHMETRRPELYRALTEPRENQSDTRTARNRLLGKSQIP
jgi:N-carbamoylputrescine amidase